MGNRTNDSKLIAPMFLDYPCTSISKDEANYMPRCKTYLLVLHCNMGSPNICSELPTTHDPLCDGSFAQL
jgi:hypothetical protein